MIEMQCGILHFAVMHFDPTDLATLDTLKIHFFQWYGCVNVLKDIFKWHDWVQSMTCILNKFVSKYIFSMIEMQNDRHGWFKILK